MPTLHVLGSGSCFPHALQKGRQPSGYLIQWDTHSILLDCSQGIAERLEKIGVRPEHITHCAISHAHPDHFALPQFLQSSLCSAITHPDFSWDDTSRYPTLSLYAPAHIIKNIPSLNKIHFEERTEKTSNGLPFPILKLITLPAKNPVSLSGGAYIQGFSVYHGFGKVDAIAMRLTFSDGTVLCYSGDTGLCDALLQAAKDADLFICVASEKIGVDSTAYEYGKLTPQQAGEIARNANVKHLLLTHHVGFDHPRAMKKNCKKSGFAGKISIADDGKKIRV